jgi:protein transport protein SEC24
LTPNNQWICPFCATLNDPITPGCVELTAPVYDMLPPPDFDAGASAVLVFLIDLSRNALTNGFTAQCLASIRASLASLPTTVKIGLLTFSDVVTVYDFRRHIEFVIADLREPISPSVNLQPLSECLGDIDSVLEHLLDSPNPNPSQGHCLGSAIEIARQILEQTGGIAVCCCSGYPSLGDYSVTASASGETPAKRYQELGFEVNRSAVSVHLFYQKDPNQGPADIVPMVFLVSLASGSFHAYDDLSNLHGDLFETLSGTYMWDASMRLRTSAGIKITAVLANVSIRARTLYGPVLGLNQTIGFELKVEKELKPPVAVLQVATLWSSQEGRRFLRVMTFGIPVSDQIGQIRASVDEAAMAVFLLKSACTRFLAVGPVESGKMVKERFAAIVFGLKYCSIYHLVHGLLSSEIFRARNARGDPALLDIVTRVRTLSVMESLLFIYTRLFVADREKKIMPLGTEAFQEGYVVVVHTLRRIFVWVNPDGMEQVCQEFFGVPELPAEITTCGSEGNARLHEIVNESRMLSGRYLPVEIIVPGSGRDSVFTDILVDIAAGTGTDLKTFLLEFAPFA